MNKDLKIIQLQEALRQYEEENDQLKKENDQLKKEREKAKNYNLEYGQLLIKATNKNNKLKQTLAEIKEFCIDHTQLIHDAYPYLNIILDKINEAEDE